MRLLRSNNSYLWIEREAIQNIYQICLVTTHQTILSSQQSWNRDKIFTSRLWRATIFSFTFFSIFMLENERLQRCLVLHSFELLYWKYEEILLKTEFNLHSLPHSSSLSYQYGTAYDGLTVEQDYLCGFLYLNDSMILFKSCLNYKCKLCL